MCLREIPGWPRQECLGTLYCLLLILLLLLSLASMLAVNPVLWQWNRLAQAILFLHGGMVVICIFLWGICIFTPGYQCWFACTRKIRQRVKCLCLCEELDKEDEESSLIPA